MATAEDVGRIGLSLPEATQNPEDFRLLLRGKAFAWPYMERVDPKKARVRRTDVWAVRVAGEWDKQALLSVDPDTFFTTDHYMGYPAVLVRLAAIDEVELEELLIGAWRTRAPRSLLAEFDRQRSA